MVNPRSDSCRFASPDLDCTAQFWFWTHTSQDMSCWKTYPYSSMDISTTSSLHPTNGPMLQSTLQCLHTDTFTLSQTSQEHLFISPCKLSFFLRPNSLAFLRDIFLAKGNLRCSSRHTLSKSMSGTVTAAPLTYAPQNCNGKILTKIIVHFTHCSILPSQMTDFTPFLKTNAV